MAAEKHVDVEVSQENGQKHKRKLESTVLDCFSKLNKDKESIRIKGGMVLMKHLAFNKETDSGIHELKYSLGRLIRGVGSTNNTARIGFYSTLATIIQTSNCTVEELLELATKELQTSGSNSKSENADILTGNILVCGAILRSHIFLEASSELQQKVIQLLLTCSKKKSYLTLLGYTFLVESLDKLTEKQFQKIMLPGLEVEITKSLDAYTLDNLYLLLKIQEKFPKIANEEFMQRIINHNAIISENTLHDVTEVLLNVLPLKNILKHPVYEIVCGVIASTNLNSQFINEIDVGLVKATYMRHSVATLLLTNIVKKTSDFSILPEIFTDKFLTCTLTHFKTLLSKNDDDLQLSVYVLFDSIVEALKKEDVKSKIKVNVIKRLLLSPGIFIFEKITRSKVIQQITADLNVEGVKRLAKFYGKVLMAEQGLLNSSETFLNMDRRYASQLIVKLMAHPMMKNELDWKIVELKMLCDQAFFKSSQGSNIGSDLSGSLRETFFRAIDQKLPKLDDLIMVHSELMHHIDAQLAEDKYVGALRVPFSEQDFAMWKRTVKLINKLESKGKKGHLNPVFRMLFLNMNLQLLNDHKLATDTLNELFSCYERIKKDKKKGKHVGEECVEGDVEGDDIKWIEVVVDLFLNLLSHSTHLLRNLIGSVFPFLCQDLTETAVHQILSVLDPKSDDNPLSSNGMDSDSDEDSDGQKDQFDEESPSEDEEESEISDDNMEDDIQNTINDKLRQAVSDALGNGGAISDQESIDLDDMSEGECEKLNATLGAAFKQFKPNMGKKSRKQTKDEETLTHFRIRVLDLIQIYLGSEPSMLLCLEIMLPLLQALEFAIKDQFQKPLQDRLGACLKRLGTIKKFSSTADVDYKLLRELLGSLLQKGTKNAIMFQDMGDKISDCCVFVIRCSQHLGNMPETSAKTKKKLMNGIHGIVQENLDTFFKKRDCLTPYVLFKTIFNINYEGNILLVPDLIQYAFSEETRPFRRSQALELLKIFYANYRSLSTNMEMFQESLVGVEKSLYEETITLLGNGDVVLREKFVTGLFSLLTFVRNSPIKTDAFDWPNIADKVRDYRSGVSFSNDAKVAYRKLCSALKVSNIVKMKPKLVKLSTQNDDENEIDGKTEKNKRRTQRMNNEKHKLKKETQLLRMQSLSEGLTSNFAFSDANVNDLKEAEPSDDDSGAEVNPTVNGKGKKHRKRNGSESEIATKKKKNKRKLEEDEPTDSSIQADSDTEITTPTVNGKVKKHRKRDLSESEAPPIRKKKNKRNK